MNTDTFISILVLMFNLTSPFALDLALSSRFLSYVLLYLEHLARYVEL